jgi:hypothetical protein
MIKLSGHLIYISTLIALFLALAYCQSITFKNKALEKERYCYASDYGLVIEHKYAPEC